jgi:O-acetylhomoserine/O-acetylserine sulfhydrylase-like pyridoxal-dependent enzyme
MGSFEDLPTVRSMVERLRRVLIGHLANAFQTGKAQCLAPIERSEPYSLDSAKNASQMCDHNSTGHTYSCFSNVESVRLPT